MLLWTICVLYQEINFSPQGFKPEAELKLLDLRFMRILPEGVVFELPGMTTTSSEIIPVFFAKFDDCESIVFCAVCSHTFHVQTFLGLL